MHRRFDSGELRAPERLPNGWLRAEGYLTKTGVFEYRRADGSTRRELRLPEEVFNEDTLRSFSLLPITEDHPTRPLDASNTTQLARGSVGEQVVRDGDFVRASLLVTDGGLVQRMDAGQKQELSCGYLCDLEESPGVTESGERYDAIQRRIRGNHVAVVARGRAGSDVRVRLDADDAIQIGLGEAQAKDNETGMIKVRIDGIEAEVSEQAAQLLARKDELATAQLTKEREAAAAAKAEADRQRARADAADAALQQAEKARADAADPVRVRELVKARVALEGAAREVLGTETRFDELDDMAIRRAVVQKLSPEARLDGQSDAYLLARYDLAVEQLCRRNPVAEVRRPLVSEQKSDSLPDARAARERFKEASRNAWQQK